MNSRAKLILIIIGIFILGFLVSWLVQDELDKNVPAAHQVRENLPGHDFINPLLYTDNNETSPEYQPLKNDLNDLVTSLKSQGQADSISVYFRDLNTGKWTGIDENVLYEPSSMLKVLVLMAYLRLSESDSSALSTHLSYTAADDPGQNFKPVHIIPSGQYTVDTLLHQMIVDSDNQAADTLVKGNPVGLNLAYTSLQLPQAPTQNIIDFMSPKSYSVLFRTLYNSTYLARSNSEKALELLSQTTFTKGLVAGVPSGIKISHKFGEHTTKTVDGTVVSRELHDCGIIYKPQSPYLLCIMTKGDDFNKLEGVISSISKKVYDEVIK